MVRQTTPKVLHILSQRPSLTGSGITSDLAHAITTSIPKPRIGDPTLTIPEMLSHFTWRAVFDRIEQVWRSVMRS